MAQLRFEPANLRPWNSLNSRDDHDAALIYFRETFKKTPD